MFDPEIAISRAVTYYRNRGYDDVIDYAWDIGIRNAFIQEGGSQSESFIPEFDIDNLTE